MHSICYAYPTSDLAEQAGGHGYIVTHADSLTLFGTYPDALAYAQTLGTEPDRWSIDHPKNASLREEAGRAARYHARMFA